MESESDTCLDPGHTVQTYLAYDNDWVRPLGASWLDGSDGQPIANTGKPLITTAHTTDEAPHVRPHEAESRMGLEPGPAEGPGITAKNRLTVIGGRWDINVTSVLLAHLKPRSVEAFAAMHTSQLATAATDADLKSGQYVTELFEGDWEKVAHYSNSLQEHTGDRAVGKLLADMAHCNNVCYSASLVHTVVLDSGDARHVHLKVVIAT